MFATRRDAGPMKKVPAVLIQVMHQDPAVVADGGRGLFPVQPVVAKSAKGFGDGPVCDRVAVVDLSITDGSLRPPATFIAEGGQYKGVGKYDVPTPTGGVGAVWARGERIDLDELRRHDGDTGFIKVSAFGTVLRAIAFVEDPVVLGHPVAWAFGSRQILVVPCAGDLDNAFYHRPSRSLQFYSYQISAGHTLHTALSQDIVTHETAHALIDGIAPDLYDAVAPESLAIHESVADLTAAMISLRSRDPGRTRPAPAAASEAILRSSRYSRIAEELGSSRGRGNALRDAINDRTLNPRARKPTRVVDQLSPHSLSEVLTGAIYAVLVRSLRVTLARIQAGEDVAAIRGQPKALHTDPFRGAAGASINRIGSMVFKGLDWLPPGEATFADFVRAMLAADRFHHPDLPDERSWLLDECVRRRIAPRGHLECALQDPETQPSEPAAASLLDRAVARSFVTRNRDLVGVPPGPFTVRSSASVRVEQPLLHQGHLAEGIELDPVYREQNAVDRVALVKVSWWETRPVELADHQATASDVKVGATLAIDEHGRLRALLRIGTDARATQGRHDYLRRLSDSGVLVAAGEDLGPDGEPLHARVPTTITDGAMRVHGSFHALHIADG